VIYRHVPPRESRDAYLSLSRMKTASSLLLSALLAAPALSGAPETAESAPPRFLEDVFRGGKFNADFRLRYEFADQEGLDASHAATLRSRLGYGTNPRFPLSAFIELEDIRAADGSAYNQAGLNNLPQKTVIADPEVTELNQAYLNFQHANLSARLGRQRIILDNHRFVGNVGWRQNEQTFDAATLQYQVPEGPAFVYSYIDQVNRVFGRNHPMGRWDSDSHVLNARSPLPVLSQGAAYAYLLQFTEAPAMSGDTFGAWVKPVIPGLPVPVHLHLEAAYQVDNAGSPAGANFDHWYFRSEVETKIQRFTVGAGWERLSGDGTTAFQTPLATLHAFNGWADQFLATPALGLDDLYAFVATKLPWEISGRVNAHHFSSHRGNITYGHELGLMVSRPVATFATILAKAAVFDGKENRPDVTKLWLQSELRF